MAVTSIAAAEPVELIVFGLEAMLKRLRGK